MKIIFDTDGTLTDFNKFVYDNAIDYFINEYGMVVKYPNELEVEDIFDMDSFFMNYYKCSLEEAKQYTKKALDKFWVNLPRFLKFSLLGKFRDGAKEFIKDCKKKGYKIEIHTSRSKVTEDNLIGEVCRKFTYLQYLINGVNLPYNSFYFYKNDEEKIIGIKKSNPDIVFEDKEYIVSELSKSGIKTICVDGNHNKSLKENVYAKKLDNFDKEKIEDILENILGKKNYLVKQRISESDKLYKKVRMVIPVILNKFNPIVLHPENIIQDDNVSVLVVPNHRSTLDPLIITSIMDKNIHWAALKRFFDGKDSIFNNSKNPLLCKITSEGFKRMEYFPIERLRDNPNANNLNSIKDMRAFLKNSQYVGIFPEGTTNRPKNSDFGTFDSGFINLAYKYDTWIQPVTVLWIKELEMKNKVIINYGVPFKILDKSKEEVYETYVNIQKQNLEENKEFAKFLKENQIKLLKRKK